MPESAADFVRRIVAGGARAENLRELARGAGFEVRRVRLRERNWRRFAALPGVAYYAANHRPVALLPSALGAYRSGREPLEPDAFLVSERLPSDTKSMSGLVLGALARERANVVLMGATGLASAVCGAAIPWETGIARAGLLGAAVALLQLLRTSVGLRLSGKLSLLLVPGFWGRVLRAAPGYFHAARPEEIALAGQSVGPACVAIGADAVEFATASLTALVVAIGLIARCGPAGIAAAVVGLSMAAARLVARYLGTSSAEAAEAKERANSGIAWLILLDVLSLRLLGAAERLAARYLESHRDAVDGLRRKDSVDVWLSALAAICPAAILMPATLLPANSPSTISYLEGTALILWSLSSMDRHSPGLFRIAVAARRSAQMLAADSEPEVPEKRDVKPRGAIGLEDISFSWPCSGPPALEGVTLAIEPGEFVCFSGPSGSGKSTLIRLLLGLERPVRGEVSYDGHRLRELDIETVRAGIELISQDERLDYGTVRTNILGMSAGSLDDAWAAARIACIDDAIRAMPLGMMTYATEQVFSSGERQRLFIARALVNRPAILILDETLSGLDEELQARIVANLRNVPGLTCIIASHRPGLAGIMDRTWRFERGRVVGVETGKPIRSEPRPEAVRPARPPIFLPEAVERFHAPEPLDRIVRLWPC